MAQWLIIAALATIGVTLMLIGVFYRVNRRVLERHQAETRRRTADSGGEGGPVYAPQSSSQRHDGDSGGDGGGDGGGD